METNQMGPTSHEVTFYYSGISETPPKLVYRTGKDPWVEPTGPEAYRRLGQLRGVFGHKLNDNWKDLGPKVRDLLDSQGVLFTSIDVVRFIRDGEWPEPRVISPVILWIGVLPDTLLVEDAFTSGNGCLNLLADFGITDVEVEYRESVYTRSVGPDLLSPVSNRDPLYDVSGPLTPTLGLSISAFESARPNVQGTMGLYLAEGGESDRVLGVTCRHVLFGSNETAIIEYIHTHASAPRRKVQLLGTRAFEELLTSIKSRIWTHRLMVRQYGWDIEGLQEADENVDCVGGAKEELERAQQSLDNTNKAIKELEQFYERLGRDWGQASQRIIGHVLRSPPISLDVGPEGFTEDYAIFELERSKFEKVFEGNVIDLGTDFPLNRSAPNRRYPLDDRGIFKHPNDRSVFEKLHDRLLPLRDFISEELMRHPDALDNDNEVCLPVMKKGNTTPVTIGRATGVFSYIREYFPNGTHQTSMEWAICNNNGETGNFSAPGDSGSVVVDGLGRIGGLITGGSGKADSPDITYATPWFWLFPRIKANGFPDAHLCPVMDLDAQQDILRRRRWSFGNIPSL